MFYLLYSNPEHRGLLEVYRNKWRWEYRHTPHHLWKRTFRRMKTFQERKMWYACDIEIRGRRSARSLPEPWDDFYITQQKTWKKLKIRKQYMVNIRGCRKSGR